MLHKPTRRELIKYGIGASAFSRMAQAQTVRIPGPGGSPGASNPQVVFKQALSAGVLGSTSVTVNITPQSNTSVLVVGVDVEANGGATITGVADGTNGAYTLLTSSTTAGNFAKLFVYYVKNTTTSAITITVSFAGTTLGSMSVFEFSGVNSTPIGNNAIGNLASGTGTDINTSTNLVATLGDAVVVFTDNYFTATFSVGATNPGGITIPAGATHTQAGGQGGNITGSYAILAGAYNAHVGNNPGTGVNDYGNSIGVQIKHA